MTNFHFVLKDLMKKRFREIARTHHFPLRHLMGKVLTSGMPVLENYQTRLIDEENRSEVKGFECDAYALISPEVKRRILTVRASAHIWSMAIIVRQLLLLFLLLYDEYGYRGAFEKLAKFGKEHRCCRQNFYLKNEHMLRKTLGNFPYTLYYDANWVTLAIRFNE